MGINAAGEPGVERRPAPRGSHYYRVRMDVEDFFFEPFTVIGVWTARSLLVRIVESLLWRRPVEYVPTSSRQRCAT